VRILRWLGVLSLGVIGVLLAFAWAVHEPLPEGETGPEADALARRIESWAEPEAWASTGIVEWTFRGVNHHVWDRDRGFVRVRRGNQVAWLRLSDGSGIVEQDGVRLEHHRAQRALESAHARWINDSFWLNPLVKLFDAGTRRELVSGKNGGLLVIYNTGGVTPGDAYLWEVDDDGRPVAWRMWVRIIPIGGVRATWNGWKTLATGARISTEHELALGTLEISDVRGGSSYLDIGFEEDPFRPLSRAASSGADRADP